MKLNWLFNEFVTASDGNEACSSSWQTENVIKDENQNVNRYVSKDYQISIHQRERETKTEN